MSLDAVVAEAGRALGGARSLYGESPMASGWSSTGRLAAAGGDVAGAIGESDGQWQGSAGRTYRDRGSSSVQALDSTVAADKATGDKFGEGADEARRGRAGMDRTIGDTRSGVAAIAPSTGTQAGKEQMVAHLQGQLSHAKAQLRVSEQRNVLLAMAIRNAGAGYRGGTPGGGGPMGGGLGSMMSPPGGGSGGGAGSGLSLPNFSGLLGAAKGKPHAGAQAMDHAAQIGSGGSSAAQQAVRSALTKQGRPYVWGAKGPNAFDCSGLVQWAYAQAGITLGPDTYSQIKQGAAVQPGDITVGDIIFPHAGHVVMAISPTQVIEAQQSGVPVKISPMPTSYLAARRVA
ncbi:C40 family peptidase [Mycobacteroides abscessus]|uniref:C40 family peptidase n=3 Tax=Mycobacteroides abscessus TaxID=36809 RepID=UPI0039EE5B60